MKHQTAHVRYVSTTLERMQATAEEAWLPEPEDERGTH